MSVHVMSLVWSLDLPDSQKIVLLALADCANDEGHCWPSMATLARKCSKGHRTIQGVIKDLVAAGHLTRNEIAGRGCNYLVHPRRDCAPQGLRPATSAPRKHRTPPPQALRDTPAAAADKPSRNHQEPSVGSDPGGSPPPDDQVSRDEVLDAWNDTASDCGLARIAKLTGERRRKLDCRLREHPFEDWAAAFQAIRRSKFLQGDNNRGWRANFDFLLRPDTITKLIEGQYDDTRQAD